MRDAILFVGAGGAKLVKKGVVWVWKGGKWVILEVIPTGAVLASKLYNKVGDALIRGSIKLEYAVSKIKILQRIQNWNYGGGRGVSTSKLLENANQTYKSTQLTKVGRALTKHPNISRFTGNSSQINQTADQALRNIINNGAMTIRQHAKFGKIIEYKLQNGLGARFSITGEFIGFLGR